MPLLIPHPIWVISDIHLDSVATHRMELAPSGRFYRNDLDTATFARLLQAMRDHLDQGLIPAPEAILVLGDLVGHQRSSSNAVEASQRAVVQAMEQYFPQVPVAYTFGNNDSFAVNYGPYSVHNVAFLSPSLIHSNSMDGYYSAYLYPQLRLISLNSVMFSPRALGVTPKTVAMQLTWLRQELADAVSKNEKMLIMMHIPPGNNTFDGSFFWQKEVEEDFTQLLRQYAMHIVGVFAAHTHKDELKIIYNAMQQPVLGVYLNAALSTSHGNAPSLRVYSFNETQQGWAIDNYTTYSFAEQAQQQITMRALYDYRTVYCQAGELNLTACLSHVTPEKTAQFLSAGNFNYSAKDRISWLEKLTRAMWNALAWLR